MDIEKTIDELRYIKEYFHVDKGSLELAINILEKQLKDKWIPVSERLPNDTECNEFDDMHPNHRKFLCTIKIADYEPQIRVLFLSEVFGWKYGADDYNKYVIAWKPLPELYKEVN
ncbi:hypothetical protein CIW83_09515 [Tissierella sp. P1]|uniref:hypothetical protein n=1 Tax=Tissierella sp. P1 TaxID=1280483 RepID=UPI000BA08347|nr:hypothetical protein [Tissierella sp. P1]OZV12324.1 hypothetical protein CIW83_09515 [Tissierella sp. P1]